MKRATVQRRRKEVLTISAPRLLATMASKAGDRLTATQWAKLFGLKRPSVQATRDRLVVAKKVGIVKVSKTNAKYWAPKPGEIIGSGTVPCQMPDWMLRDIKPDYCGIQRHRELCMTKRWA
jgi:hypothetical protein